MINEDPISDALRELVKADKIFAWNVRQKISECEPGKREWTICETDIEGKNRALPPLDTDEVLNYIMMYR